MRRVAARKTATRKTPRAAALSAFASLFIAGCAASNPLGSRYLPLDDVAIELESLTPGLSDLSKEAFRDILATTVAEDAYTCTPSPRQVFFGDEPEGERHIAGVMPHYGFFFGPMSYNVRHSGPREGRAGHWDVSVVYAVELPDPGGKLELADCDGKDRFEGEVICSGKPYALSGTTEACPGSGEFFVPGSRHNMEALLARWSEEAETYWNRDAERFGLPIHYDFTFVPQESASQPDIVLPLSRTCGRTPYFTSLRSGWSLPVIAHEVGHLLGLMDEYESLSGIVPFYPKTPFRGAETSRMGLSMKEDTILYPIHHWLVLRRFSCPEPSGRDPWGHAFQ